MKDISVDVCPNLGFAAEFKDNILTKLDVLAHIRISGGKWYTIVTPVALMILLICSASAQLPSDLITKQPAPACIDLRNVAPASAKAIDSINPELQAFTLTEMAGLGHYNAALISVTQEELDTATEAIKAFIGGNESKGNSSVEPMNLTEYNNTLVWF